MHQSVHGSSGIHWIVENRFPRGEVQVRGDPYGAGSGIRFL